MRKRTKLQVGEDLWSVAIYARKSRITNKGDSIGVQFKQSADYAINQLSLPENYEFLHYEDKGLSGYYSDRPDFQRLLHDIDKGKIKAVACYKLDRISRKTSDLMRLLEYFERHNVTLLVCSNNINTKISTSKIIIQVLAIIAEFGGIASIRDTKKKREIVITNPETGETKAYLIPYGSRIKVMDGALLEAGDELTEGSVNPHDLLKIKGIRAVQDYMLREVQRVYRLQGVDISDKHIEVIVRQMLKKVRIENNGDTDFLPGALVDVLEYEDMNEQLYADGKEPAEGKQVMLGITKAALATNSFLSAASFQETTKVLTEAAIKGKVDPLIGLKENVIIGKLIPAGTGMRRYRNTRLSTDNDLMDTIDFEMDEEEPDKFMDEDAETVLDLDEADEAEETEEADEIMEDEEEVLQEAVLSE